MYALTPEIMRKIDAEQALTKENGERTLMLSAGLCAVQVIMRKSRGRVASVLCGAGNNGGDGYVIGKYLSCCGWDVKIFEYAPAKKRTPAAEFFRDEAKEANCAFYTLNRETVTEIMCCDVVVDAVFGTGFKGALDGELSEVFEAIKDCGALKIAIDCPSGVDPVTAKAENGAFYADITACMSYPMRGIYLLPARQYAGKIEVCRICMDYEDIEKNYVFNDIICDEDYIRSVFKPRGMYANKGTFGRALLICGSTEMPGAARLALSGALRMGAGLCELCAPRDVILSASAAFPEPIYTKAAEPCDYTDADIDAVIERAKRSTAVLCGCGLGQSDGVKELVRRLLAFTDCPVVLDADALNVLAGEDWRAEGEVYITPHLMEFSRLTGLSIEEISADKYEIAKRFAGEHNVTLVLKGADTVICSPDGKAAINPTGNGGLAKGGSGDVLAGMLAGILAFHRGFEAPVCAAYLHGAAGDYLCREYSEYSYLTGELARAAGIVLGEILNEKSKRAEYKTE